MSDAFSLPDRLDTASAAGLLAALQDRRGAAATLDGSGVGFAGALGLQVLVSARRTWDADGQAFRITAPSAALTDACRQLGLSGDDIGITGTEITGTEEG